MASNDNIAMTKNGANVGIIIGSQRIPRVGPQIATWVLNVLQEYQDSHSSTNQRAYALSLIDLNDHQLPLFDEPGIPAQISAPDGYAHEHTKAWSRRINSFDGFVFVTPQYNWGYPASLKNAIDYLFHEWKGKPALVVSYGGHGGGKAAAQLQGVLGGIGMKVVEKAPPLTFIDREQVGKAFRGEDLGLEGEAGRSLWVKEREDVGVAWEQFLGLLNK
ncbi:hypothetical protein LTR84_011713 [Exophiala bonariae]|uniref:FMN reductase [NAD(P)H] n=1 Tax=Exophiala bonariae TaxID=1690606 RepID=A0AAV9NGS2_9EURO|nr:hypothetical protein LTR84_011713 [Exophiala bonariae]